MNHAAEVQGHNMENTLLSWADDEKHIIYNDIMIIMSLRYLRLIKVKSTKSEELFS